MIRIWHIPQFRSVRVIWLMEELGEPYELALAPTAMDDDFKARTGVLAVPTIVDGDIVMGESIAILQYLTGRRLQRSLELGLTVGPSPDPAAYAEHLHWLHMGEASLMMHFSMLARIQRAGGEADKAGYAARTSEARARSRLDALERRLADDRPWLTGERLTIADISVGYALGYARFRGLDAMLPEGARGYLARVEARPAYRKAVAV